MSGPPTPPDDLPPALVDRLDELSKASLRDLATYAERLAAARNSEPDTADESEPTTDTVDSDRPDVVPSKATITIKEINDNRYFYWQWRDGETIKSKYKGPAGEG